MAEIKHRLELIKDLIKRGDSKQATAEMARAFTATYTEHADMDLAGQLGVKLNMIRPAIRMLIEATRRAPDRADYFVDLGLAYTCGNNTPKAQQTFDEALRLQPKNTRAYAGLASMYHATGNLEKPVEMYQKILAYDRNNLIALIGLGSIAEKRLDYTSAEKYARAVLKVDKHNPMAGTTLAKSLLKKKRYDEALQIIQNALAKHSDYVGAHFMHGRILHGMKRYQEAMDAFIKANAISNPNYISAAEAHKEPEELEKALLEIGRENPVMEQPTVCRDYPVFIAGMSRSGTTLLSEMLGRHPVLHSEGELRLVSSIYGTANTALGKLNSDAEINKQIWDPKNNQLVETLQEKYKDMLAELDSAKKGLWPVDKLPFNARRLAMIAKIAPGAPVIHIIRDGREVAFSNFMQGFRHYLWYSYNLEDGISEWISFIRLARCGARVFKVPYLEIHYEELVTEPEATLKKVFNFLGLEWEPDCLNFHQSKTPVLTASYSQVRTKLYTDAIGRAKNYPEQYQAMTRIAFDTLKEMGYETAV